MDIKDKNLKCPYCGGKVKLANRTILTNSGSSGTTRGSVYVCEKYPVCDAYVGCKPDTDKPLGTLADRELRVHRMKAHKAFDWLWTSNRMSRTEAYGILRKVMALKEEDAHIGMMNIEQCQQVIEIFEEYKKTVLPYKVPKSP